jgi:hypothetical protein
MASLKVERLNLHQTYLDTTIIAKEVDKGKGLLALLELVGQPDLVTTAIGDSEPDFAMFAIARQSFAPAHISRRAVARLLGCRIDSHSYQLGFLHSVRAILHPDGGRCDRCRARGRLRFRETEPLFEELLAVADQGELRSLLQTLLDPMAFQAMAR